LGSQPFRIRAALRSFARFNTKKFSARTTRP